MQSWIGSLLHWTQLRMHTSVVNYFHTKTDTLRYSSPADINLSIFPILRSVLPTTSSYISAHASLNIGRIKPFGHGLGPRDKYGRSWPARKLYQGRYSNLIKDFSRCLTVCSLVSRIPGVVFVRYWMCQRIMPAGSCQTRSWVTMANIRLCKRFNGFEGKYLVTKYRLYRLLGHFIFYITPVTWG